MHTKAMTWTLVLCGLAAMALAGGPANPLAKAQVGDWLLYAMQGGMQQKQTVVAVSDTAVKVKIDTLMNGSSINSMEMDMPLKAEDSGAAPAGADVPKPKISEATLAVKGKSLTCTITEVEAQGMVTRTWTCDGVPVTGVAQAEVGGSITMSLVDYGHGG